MSSVLRPTAASALRRLRDRGYPRARRQDLTWLVGIVLPSAVLLAWLISSSLRAAVALVIVIIICGLHQHSRRAGIISLIVFWCLAPELRRVLGTLLGFAGNDPLSVAPFVASVLLAALELYRAKLPIRVRRLLVLAGIGFLIGFPLGLLHPRSGLYGLLTYLAGLAVVVLGANETTRLHEHTLRRVLIVVGPLLALYGILAQRLLTLPSWEQDWLSNVSFTSIGTDSSGQVRLFSTVNAPGTLAPLLGLALLTYITISPPHGRARYLVVAAVTVMAVALDLTFVRSSWLALPVAAIAHVVASRGRSARLVLGTAALIVVGTLALTPVSSTARDVVTRVSTFGSLNNDTSATARTTTLSQSFPAALQAPVGHGLGTAGQPSLLNSSQADLAIPDDGYLALMYQVGPVGFLLVMAALAAMVRSAWCAARYSRTQSELGALLFSMLVFLLVVLASGDVFYGLGGLLLWFIGGNALMLDQGGSGPRRMARA